MITSIINNMKLTFPKNIIKTDNLNLLQSPLFNIFFNVNKLIHCTLQSDFVL